MHTSLVSAWSNWLPHLLDGLLVSLQVTGLSLVIGFSAGLVLALLLSSSQLPRAKRVRVRSGQMEVDHVHP